MQVLEQQLTSATRPAFCLAEFEGEARCNAAKRHSQSKGHLERMVGANLLPACDTEWVLLKQAATAEALEADPVPTSTKQRTMEECIKQTLVQSDKLAALQFCVLLYLAKRGRPMTDYPAMQSMLSVMGLATASKHWSRAAGAEMTTALATIVQEDLEADIKKAT